MPSAIALHPGRIDILVLTPPFPLPAVSGYVSMDDLRHSVLVLTQMLYNAAMNEEPLTRTR